METKWWPFVNNSDSTSKGFTCLPSKPATNQYNDIKFILTVLKSETNTCLLKYEWYRNSFLVLFFKFLSRNMWNIIIRSKKMSEFKMIFYTTVITDERSSLCSYGCEIFMSIYTEGHPREMVHASVRPCHFKVSSLPPVL